MDKLDRKILNIIQEDGRASVKSIAEKMFHFSSLGVRPFAES